MMRRVSPALIVLRGVDAVKVYLPFMLLQGSVAERLPGWLQLPWLALVIYYSLTRIQLLFFDWLTTRFAITSDGITQQTGWPTRHLAHARWAEIGGLHLDQDLSHRLLGRYRARAVVGAEGRDEILLEALDADDVAELRDHHGDASDRRVVAADAAPQDAVVVHRTSWRDKLLISFTHGQFLLIVPFILGAYSDLAEFAGLPSGAAVLDHIVAGGMGAAAWAVAAAFGFGLAHTAVRYHGYTVVRSGHTFTASGGLLHHQARDARIADVRGVRISQNPLMRLTGCSSLSLVLATARGEFKSLVVLPVAPTRQAERLAVEVLPGLAADRSAPVRTPVPTLAGLLAIPVAAAATAAWYGLPWVAALIGCLVLLTANTLWARLETPLSGDVLVHRRGLFGVRGYAVRLEGVRSVESWLIRSDGDRLSRTTVMDRRTTHLWAFTPAATIDPLTMRILSAEQGVCR